MYYILNCSPSVWCLGGGLTAGTGGFCGFDAAVTGLEAGRGGRFLPSFDRPEIIVTGGLDPNTGLGGAEGLGREAGTRSSSGRNGITGSSSTSSKVSFPVSPMSNSNTVQTPRWRQLTGCYAWLARLTACLVVPDLTICQKCTYLLIADADSTQLITTCSNKAVSLPYTPMHSVQYKTPKSDGLSTTNSRS